MLRSNIVAFIVALGVAGKHSDSSYTQHVFGGQEQNIESTNLFDNEFEQLVYKSLDFWKVPGASVAVVDGDNVFAKGFGIATFPSTNATPSTLYFTGSTTKAFTAAMMSLLVDDNDNFPNVQWSTPVSELIRDDFVLEDPYYTAHITVEDILSHRSGMARHDASYGGHYNGHKATPSDIVRSLRYIPLTAEPRTKFQYCNMMYVAASHVIETLTGSWLGDLLHDNIWQPLNMTSTYFSAEQALRSKNHVASGYHHDKSADRFVEVGIMNYDAISGAGSIVSNVLDYAKWLKSLMDLAGPLSNDGHRAIRTPRSFVPQSIDVPTTPFKGPLAYSLGWLNGNYNGMEFYQHDGGVDAYGTTIIFIPSIKFAVASFANTGSTANNVGKNLVWRLVDDKMGVPKEERFDWDKVNLATVMRQEKMYDNPTPIFFPNLPTPTLKPTLPLESYTGTYRHPAYRNITLVNPASTSSNSSLKLYANRTDVTWPVSYEFDHVSGENWVFRLDSLKAPGGAYRDAGGVTFKVGVAGLVEGLGIGMEAEMGIDGRIWFDRIG